MMQLELPLMPAGQDDTERIVNVASVKHRSPFRYPGGKTWLVPRVFRWLASLPEYRRVEFIEPFAGGAIVGLSVAFEKLASKVTLVELDEQVASVWNTILTQNQGEWLAERVLNFRLTPENVDSLLASEPATERELAFQTIVKNRINRGGILAEGAGRVKYGENGRGIKSRWYPNTLSRRILDIISIRDRIQFIHGDGLKVIEETSDRNDVVYFIDPPYTAAGKKPGSRLYTFSELDHAELFRLVSHTHGDFLLTYDNVEEVRTMAKEHCFDTEAIVMKTTHHTRLTELLIGRNLDWIRRR